MGFLHAPGITQAQRFFHPLQAGGNEQDPYTLSY